MLVPSRGVTWWQQNSGARLPAMYYWYALLTPIKGKLSRQRACVYHSWKSRLYRGLSLIVPFYSPLLLQQRSGFRTRVAAARKTRTVLRGSDWTNLAVSSRLWRDAKPGSDPQLYWIGLPWNLVFLTPDTNWLPPFLPQLILWIYMLACWYYFNLHEVLILIVMKWIACYFNDDHLLFLLKRVPLHNLYCFQLLK